MTAHRPSRFYVAKVYFKRIVRWRRNSSPFISGDAFADFSDFVYKMPRFRRFKRQQIPIENAQIIFCRSEDLAEMIRLYGERITARVIICGNSDFEFHTVPDGIPKSVRALFLQNSFISNEINIFTIPIGLENLRWGVNGHPKLLKRLRRNTVKNEILFGPFGNTHAIRSKVLEDFGHSQGPWRVLPSTRIGARKYSRIARTYRYIAAVRGNGVDTHRLWESLYRGIYPITLRDPWSESLHCLCLPIKEISLWANSEIRKTFGSLPKNDFDPRKLETLWMPFWEKKIHSFLDQNSAPVAPK